VTTLATRPQQPPVGGPPAARPWTALAGPPLRPAETGVWIGIATISMSFAALTSAMLVRGSAAADWQHFRLPAILYFNTLVLVVSSVTLETARRRVAPAWVRVTLALGVLFVAGQVAAWRQLAAQGLFLATSPSSSFFYVFTALHGLHVLGGVGGLVYVLRRLRPPRPAGAPPPTALGAATLYWHFMDVLWVYLLILLTTRV
jgi:cytochrome c oxidase subunit 3